MQNPESVQENEAHKIPWDFEIKTDHLISIRRLNLGIVKKTKKLPNGGLCRYGWPQVKNKRKWKDG